QRLPRNLLDEGAPPLLRLQGNRLRRLALPGGGDHRQRGQHRSRLRAVALSRRDGAACARGGCESADAIRLSQSAQRGRSLEGRAPVGARGIANGPSLYVEI